MTVQSDLSKVQHDGNGVATVFDFQFRIFDEAELIVIVTDAAGTDTTLTLGTDYTIAGVGEDQGTVTYPVSGSPLPVGSKITIMRVLDVVQQTALENQGGYYPDVVEAAFDRIVMIAQQLQEALDRAIKVSPSDPEGLQLPAARQRANKLLAFDATGKPAVVEDDRSGETVTAEGTSDARSLAAWMAALLAEIADRVEGDASLSDGLSALGGALAELDAAVSTPNGSGKLPIATQAQAEAGTHDASVMTPQRTKQARDAAWAGRSLTTHGYQVFPSGLIIQWGNDTAPANGTSVALNFPIAFPNAAFMIVGATDQPGPGAVDGNNSGALIVSKSQYKVFYDDATPTVVHWIALGY